MGNALRSHDNLVHVRGWTREQIGSVFDTLRRKRAVYSLTREEFTRYFGGRKRELLTVFGDLDTDCDGRVDIFEVIVVVTLWSGTSWEEKQEILFELFDMMGKGFLKMDEIILMGTVIVQAMRKFVRLDDDRLAERSTIQDLAQQAISPNEAKITLEHFQAWAKSCRPLKLLQGFVEDHAARGQEDSKISRMRIRIAEIERHAARLFERVQQLQDRLPDFADACIDFVSAFGRRKRWDFLMQNARHVVLKLQRLSESMHTTLADLEASLNEDEASGGMASVVNPQKRFNQEQMILNLDLMRQQSATDFREATDLLKRLIELTEANEMQVAMGADHTGGDLNVINEDEAEDAFNMSPPKVAESRSTMQQIHDDMLADTEEGGYFALPEVAEEASPHTTEQQLSIADAPRSPSEDRSPRSLAITDVSAGGTLRSNEPTLVAIADFEPPPSHQTQMLRLCVGDLVTVIGQDGRGWWYGRKQTGKEGWFPPSYVQLKPAHFSSHGDSELLF